MGIPGFNYINKYFGAADVTIAQIIKIGILTFTY